jgi:hypothetical protein
MQIKKHLASIRPDVADRTSEDDILQVLRDVVHDCKTQMATAQAWQSKFHSAAVEIDKLTGDLKRAQV